MNRLAAPRLFSQRAFVAGEWISSSDGRTSAIAGPATGRELGRTPRLGRAEIERAILAAEAAFPVWRRQPAHERGKVLRTWAELIHQHREDLARIMTLEQGKPLAESRAEIVYAASFLEWFAEEGRRIYGDTVPSKQSDRRHFVLKEPIGVCAAITPWNFPAAMITRKVGPALATGCTMVVKPAEQTPFSALALAVLGQEAGIPPGVLSVVTGSGSEIGPLLTASPVVRKLSFTGSTEVGRLLMQQCAPTLKRLSLELGGNAPFIVFDDADLDAAVDGLLASKFRNTGQTCVCANRVLVQSGVHDAFAEKLTAAVKKLTVGDGLTEGVQQGPLINEAAAAHVAALVADALAKGARVLTGGHRHALGGTFFEPTVLVGATPAMQLAQTEIFGPVAPLFRFGSEADGIALANATEHGLAAYFYSRDSTRIWRAAEALACGMIGINTGLISSETTPFGGVKQSGFGREGSSYGVDEYLELKSLTLAGL
ncbi:MAG: NAD-dependent succinate-semialdehyde dehydrogenase [Verrucomicrobia bacterium]|nr:NAD-dependent succinate-semialdehyde dehydrogenase [Verrucomicrobiota bacterium]